MKCGSSDICQKYIDGKCPMLKIMEVDIESCSQRVLTSAGKSSVYKGKRK